MGCHWIQYLIRATFIQQNTTVLFVTCIYGKKQYSEVMRYVKEARKLYDQIKLEKNIALQQVDQRLKLLETLIGEEKIDEILKEYSNTDIV